MKVKKEKVKESYLFLLLICYYVLFGWVLVIF